MAPTRSASHKIVASNLGLQAEEARTSELLREAVETKSPDPQLLNDLGYRYQYGVGVRQDYGHAFDYYRRGANKGLPLAWNNLGFCYLGGKGVRPDYARAIDCFKKAGELGLPCGYSNIGLVILSARQTVQAHFHAAKWFYLSNARGDTSALSFFIDSCRKNIADANARAAAINRLIDFSAHPRACPTPI